MCEVTIILPTQGKRIEWLKETLDSIEKQTYKPKLIIAKGKDSVHKRINKAVKEAKTKYVILFCDDDKMPPDYIENMYIFAEKHSLPIVSPFIQNFEGDIGRHGPGRHPFFSSLISRKMFLDVEGFDETMLQMADVDFWTKCFNKNYKWEVCPNSYYWYRVHSEQDSKNADWDLARKKYLEKHGKFLI